MASVLGAAAVCLQTFAAAGGGGVLKPPRGHHASHVVFSRKSHSPACFEPPCGWGKRCCKSSSTDHNTDPGGILRGPLAAQSPPPPAPRLRAVRAIHVLLLCWCHHRGSASGEFTGTGGIHGSAARPGPAPVNPAPPRGFCRILWGGLHVWSFGDRPNFRIHNA